MLNFFLGERNRMKKDYESEITNLKQLNNSLMTEIQSLQLEILSLNNISENKNTYTVYEKNDVLNIINGKNKIQVSNPNYKKHKKDRCAICTIKRPIYNTHCGASVCVKCFLDPLNSLEYGNKCLICKLVIYLFF